MVEIWATACSSATHSRGMDSRDSAQPLWPAGTFTAKGLGGQVGPIQSMGFFQMNMNCGKGRRPSPRFRYCLSTNIIAKTDSSSAAGRPSQFSQCAQPGGMLGSLTLNCVGALD